MTLSFYQLTPDRKTASDERVEGVRIRLQDWKMDIVVISGYSDVRDNAENGKQQHK